MSEHRFKKASERCRFVFETDPKKFEAAFDGSFRCKVKKNKYKITKKKEGRQEKYNFDKPFDKAFFDTPDGFNNTDIILTSTAVPLPAPSRSAPRTPGTASAAHSPSL